MSRADPHPEFSLRQTCSTTLQDVLRPPAVLTPGERCGRCASDEGQQHVMTCHHVAASHQTLPGGMSNYRVLSISKGNLTTSDRWTCRRGLREIQHSLARRRLASLGERNAVFLKVSSSRSSKTLFTLRLAGPVRQGGGQGL